MPQVRTATVHIWNSIALLCSAISTHASSVGFSLAGVERLAVADREPEHRPGTDCEQRPELCALTADPWGGPADLERGRIGHRERRGFQKRTGVRRLAGTGTTAMVNRRQGQAAGY